jgi:hypothetical protein
MSVALMDSGVSKCISVLYVSLFYLKLIKSIMLILLDHFICSFMISRIFVCNLFQKFKIVQRKTTILFLATHNRFLCFWYAYFPFPLLKAISAHTCPSFLVTLRCLYIFYHYNSVRYAFFNFRFLQESAISDVMPCPLSWRGICLLLLCKLHQHTMLHKKKR